MQSVDPYKLRSNYRITDYLVSRDITFLSDKLAAEFFIENLSTSPLRGELQRWDGLGLRERLPLIFNPLVVQSVRVPFEISEARLIIYRRTNTSIDRIKLGIPIHLPPKQPAIMPLNSPAPDSSAIAQAVSTSVQVALANPIVNATSKEYTIPNAWTGDGNKLLDVDRQRDSYIIYNSSTHNVKIWLTHEAPAQGEPTLELPKGNSYEVFEGGFTTAAIYAMGTAVGQKIIITQGVKQ